VDDRLPLTADGLAVLVLDDLRVPALALVLGTVHAVGVDRVAGVARVAEDAEHGRAVPWPVLGDGLRREPFRGSALVALDHHRAAVARQLRDAPGDLGPFLAGERRGQRCDRRSVLDRE